MAGEETLHAKVDPIGGEVWETDTPLFFTLVDMRLEGEVVDTVALANQPLVILAIVVISDAQV